MPEKKPVQEITISIPKSWVRLKALIDTVPDCVATIEFVNSEPHKLRSLKPTIIFNASRDLPPFMMAIKSGKGLDLSEEEDS